MPLTISVKAIIPDALNVPRVQKFVDGALTQTGGILVRGFVPTTSTWSGDRPSFTYKTGKNSKEAWVHSYPAGAPVAIEKWNRLDKGTQKKNYPIAARRVPYLVFPFQGRGKSYRAKTQKGFLGSRPGGKVGPINRFKSVNHPGFEGREFSKTLGEREIGPFAQRIQDAVDRGL